MNLALPALVVFLLLLPGAIARSRIKLVERLSLDYSPLGQVVAETVAWAAALHAMWLSGAAWLCGRWLHTDVLLRLLSAEPVAQTRALDAVAAQAPLVAAYGGSLLAAAYFGPTLLRAAVVRWRLDRQGAWLRPLLRFHGAPWYYLLSGADFSAGEAPDFITVSAIVNVAGQPILFTGVLQHYYLDPSGQLDRLVLREAMRRPLSADKPLLPPPDAEAMPRFYPVDGDYFVLRYSDAITLNVEYITLADASAGTAPAAV